jgi:DNA-binding Lrp family transcriptional regulator
MLSWRAVGPARHFARTGRQMDDIDRRILALLQEDASRPMKTLAAEVDLSRSAVRERIARLQASGVLRRFTVEIALPGTPVTAFLLVRLERTPAPAVVARVVAMPEVTRCASLSGEIDLLVEVAAPDVAGINRARDAVASLPGVRDLETAFVLRQEKASR